MANCCFSCLLGKTHWYWTSRFSHQIKRWVEGICTFKYTWLLRKVYFNFSSNPELAHGYLQLVLFTWENIWISNSAVFPQNQALSGVICTFKYTYLLRKVCFNFSSNPELVYGYLQLVIFTWKNALIWNSAVFPQNQALSGVICPFKYT